MKNIIFIAPPAAGKGTQSKFLSEEYNIPHISTGDLLREEMAKETEIGKSIKEDMEKGNLITDEIINKLLENRLTMDDCNNGYILDGYPRSVIQAIKYEEILIKLNKEIGDVIFLEITPELALKRTVSRIVCPSCGTSYNLLINELKPSKEGICDKCNHELKVRSDDNEKTFSKRFDTYMEKTKDLIEYYKNKDVLKTIEVLETKTANEIFEEIKRIINK